jgi:uncharacterized protein
MPIVGTLINVVVVALGALVGLSTHKDLTPEWQGKVRKLLGVFLIWYGLMMIWKGLNGSFWQVSHQFVILMVSLIIGRIVGRLLRIQVSLNRLGKFARQQLSLPPAQARQPSPGFLACTIVYCAAPLAFVGALHEGISADSKPLIIKSLMDGLAMVAFVRFFGPLAALSVLPLLAYQGSCALLGQLLEPLLRHHNLVDSVEVVAGFIVVCVALVILEFKKVDLSDYLPSLMIAPLLTWWSR